MDICKYKRLEDILSDAELEVVSLILEDRSFAQMADVICIAPSTMRKHASNIYGKANVAGRDEFKSEYSELNEKLNLESFSDRLVRKLDNSINLSWNAENEFEEYYNSFYSVIRSMYNLDFSKSLPESSQKDSFVNFISQSINSVNHHLRDEFIDSSTVEGVFDLLAGKGKILLVSNDASTITHIVSGIDTLNNLEEDLKGKSITGFLPIENLSALDKINSMEFKAKLPFEALPHTFEKEVPFKIRKKGKSIIILITLFPENPVNIHLERIMRFLACIKSQYQDNPGLLNTVAGASLVLEAVGLYDELERAIKSNPNRYH